MIKPKDVLVVTTSTVEGAAVKRYVKPISAHIVSGINMFSDLVTSITDVFGGRSATYQKELTELYNEAIDRLRQNACDLGANAVIGLKVDMDEISGKGKSMLMVTAVGTAVVLDGQALYSTNQQADSKPDFISSQRLRSMKAQKEIISKIELEAHQMDEESWSVVISNQILDAYPHLIKKYIKAISESIGAADYEGFHKFFKEYVMALPDSEKTALLYNSICLEKKPTLVEKLISILTELDLYDFNKTIDAIKNNDFSVQKRGLRLAIVDKTYYSRDDLKQYDQIVQYIANNFKERGTYSTKKQLLSSKEKEIWLCECGQNNNDKGAYCHQCSKDIYGFSEKEWAPAKVLELLQERMELIKESFA